MAIILFINTSYPSGIDGQIKIQKASLCSQRVDTQKNIFVDNVDKYLLTIHIDGVLNIYVGY